MTRLVYAETEAALTAELAGHVAAGRDDRASDVTAALDKLDDIALIVALDPDPDRPPAVRPRPEPPEADLDDRGRAARRIDDHKAALAVERDGYLARGWTARAAEVDEAIAAADPYRLVVAVEIGPASGDVEPEPEVLPK